MSLIVDVDGAEVPDSGQFCSTEQAPSAVRRACLHLAAPELTQ